MIRRWRYGRSRISRTSVRGCSKSNPNLTGSKGPVLPLFGFDELMGLIQSFVKLPNAETLFDSGNDGSTGTRGHIELSGFVLLYPVALFQPNNLLN